MKKIFLIAIALMGAASMMAQESTNSGVSRRASGTRPGQEAAATPGVTDRMRTLYAEPGESLSEGDVQWMRVIYRQLDLNKDENAALYFPEDLIDGQENFIRILMRLLASGQISAYEYLDGREIFTDKYKINVKDMLDRYYIPYATAKGSTEKNPKFEIDESDVPTTEVLSYYVIENWKYDNRNNRLKTYVEAICPVLHRAGDFGGEPLKYPMFWVKFNDIRPYLAQQQIFVSDENNLPTCTYDDFFNLTMYKGDIYKTRNLRNRSLMQQFPDPEDLAQAQDSIQKHLDTFEDRLWVPDREEIIAAREAREQAQAGNGDEAVE
ncbi:MAG: gliding motility protein GldN, partial [Clostridium sp.]|nr:gliding motility protein GldN [Clostridium sp.]